MVCFISGIIPITCNELFQRIDNKKDSNVVCIVLLNGANVSEIVFSVVEFNRKENFRRARLYELSQKGFLN